MFLPEFTTPPIYLALVALVSYLVGSIAFGLVITRVLGLGDIRQTGSGNIGTTNVLRTGNKSAAATTLIFDSCKGLAPVLIASLYFGSDAAQVAGVSAFLGHLFPVWLGFKGGKGVATFLGALLGLSLFAGAAACATWLCLAFLTRFSSVASLSAALTGPFWLWMFGFPDVIAATAFMSAFVWIRHASNIRRLVDGNESKISFRSSSGD